MFDLFKIKLSGLHLIEASAGTGKTYSLCGLFFRLFLEAKINFREILLITFTNLATEELQNRVYHYLEKTFILIENNPEKDLAQLIALAERDEILKYILCHCKKDQDTFERLKEAFLNFQEIAIFTLDGFWSKISQDYSFELGNLSEKKLIENSQTKEIVTNNINRYYQKWFLKKNDEFATVNEILFQKEPEILSTLKEITLSHVLNDSLQIYRINPDFTLVDFKNQFAKFTLSLTPIFKSLALKFSQQKQELYHLFTVKELNKNKYRKIEIDLLKILKCFASIDLKSFLKNCLRAEILVKASPEKPNKLDRLSLGYLENALKKDNSLPEISAPIRESLEEVQQCNSLLKGYFLLLEEYSLYHLQTLLREVRVAYSLAKEQGDWYDYEDIPNLLLKHLTNTKDSTFQKKIFEKFQAVMIDEFQDTNQNQYQVIDKLFIAPLSSPTAASTSSNSSLLPFSLAQKAVFLIGDPKQSIYAFRKADVLSYLKVKQNSIFTLHTQNINWRSTPQVIAAQNTLFKVKNAFLYPDIPYHSVWHPTDSLKITTPDNTLAQKVNNSQSTIASLKLWVLTESQESKENREEKAKEESSKNFYQEQFTLFLIQSIKKKLAEQVAPEKIAILVEKTKELFFIKKKCLQYQIPCTTSHQSEILISDTTLSLFQFFSAVAQAEDIRLLKGLLVSSLFSFSLAEIKVFSATDSPEWLEMMVWWKNLKEIWLSHGLGAMIKVLFVPTKNQCTLLQKKLLAYRQTQLEDFTSSSEWLLREYFYNKDPFFLLKDLNTKIKKAQRERQIKTTAVHNVGAIQIMTIHQSKGLEFDFVYLPFAWQMSTLEQYKKGVYKVNHQQIYFKESLKNYLSKKEQNEIQEYQNQSFYYDFAESLRLFYVALTRAKKEIIVGYGDYQHLVNKRSFAYNPLYYYLHFAKKLENLAKEDIINIEQNLKQTLKNVSIDLKEEHAVEDLNHFLTLAKGAISKEEFAPFTANQINSLSSSSNNKLMNQDSLNLENLNFLKILPEELLAVPPKYQFYSFSALLEAIPQKEFAEKNDHNKVSPETRKDPESDNSKEKNSFTLPTGTDVGNCLHNILQETNFQIFSDDSFSQNSDLKIFLKKKVKKKIATELEIYQLPAEYQEVVWQLLQTIATLSLVPSDFSLVTPSSSSAKIQLANLQHRHTWRELEFYYALQKDPLSGFLETKQKSILNNDKNLNQLIWYLLDTKESSPKIVTKWQNIITKNPDNSLTSQVTTIKNWMRGFIDFIFVHENKYYFIDWKSNYLGESLVDYQRENLQLAMLKHNYILQHYIYSIALDNYLQNMPNYIYEENFGGGYYLFLRGLDVQKNDSGVYFFKPPKEKIDFLRRILF